MRVVLVIPLVAVQVEDLQEKDLVLLVEILLVVLVAQEEILLEVEQVLLERMQIQTRLMRILAVKQMTGLKKELMVWMYIQDRFSGIMANYMFQHKQETGGLIKIGILLLLKMQMGVFM